MVIHDLTPSPVAITVRGGIWDDDIDRYGNERRY